jgi:hypothetical protein
MRSLMGFVATTSSNDTKTGVIPIRDRSGLQSIRLLQGIQPAQSAHARRPDKEKFHITITSLKSLWQIAQAVQAERHIRKSTMRQLICADGTSFL